MSMILTLDAGTTSMKGALFNLAGRMVCSHVHEYQLDNQAPDFVELDPEIYWTATQAVIADILKTVPAGRAEITAVGVTSQGETLIALDARGKPLRKAIVWLDNRARDEAEEIKRTFDRKTVYEVTGQQDIAPCWPAAKILWLRRHEPEVFRSAAHFILLGDYLVYRLTGKYVTDHALNPSTLYYDLRRGCWWQAMLDFMGITAGQLPALLNSGAVAGMLAAEVGLSRTTAVTVAPIDQVAAAVGAGNIAPGMITETTGCALALCATVDRPLYDPGLRIGLYRHAVPGLFVLLPWIPTAGMVLRWFRDQFGEGLDYTGLAELAAGVPPGCEGLIMLPHFCGMNSPEVNPEAKGALYGLTLAHRKAHFVRAIMEAVAFALRDNLELLLAAGTPCRMVTSLGGAARSRFWLQIKADVMQRTLTTMRCEEATSLGTAVLAAAGTGAFAGIKEAVQAMVHPADAIPPDPGNREIYAGVFEKYRDLNKKLFAQQHGLQGVQP
jgi:xylulokinase